MAHKAAEKADVQWAVYHGPAHSQVEGAAAQEMAMNVLTAGKNGDLGAVTIADFEGAAGEVAQVLNDLIEIADHIEAGLLVKMDLTLRTAKGELLRLKKP